MSKRLTRAFGLALLAFIALYFGPMLFMAYDGPTTSTHMLMFLLNLDAYLAWVVAGYLAAMMIRKKNVVTGVVTGLIAACLVSLYHVLSGPALVILVDWRFWLVSALLGGLGGLIWSLQATIMQRSRSR